jgi:radical SAM superfamily enzyme YgiQ (UPF0313 family)
MESPIFPKAWKKGINKLAIVYPNLYYGGIYCLGPLIFYNQVNQLRNWLCTRHFLDNNNLKNHDLIGFTFQYELDYYNFAKILEKNNIPLDRKKRKEIIFAGGPCINTNPEALSNYIDFFIVGEAEDTMPSILSAYEENKSKQTFLEKISNIPGVFVPGLNTPSIMATVRNLDAIPYPLYQPLPKKLNKTHVFGNAFMLETERGCLFKCKFCPLNEFYSKARYRSLSSIKNIIDNGLKINKRDKVVIYAPSFIHPKRKEILQYLIDKNIPTSIPSIKAEFIDYELLKLIRKCGAKSLTVAPEAGERLRKEAGKIVPDKYFFRVMEWANELKFNSIKLYLLIGMPNQTKDDLDELIIFLEKSKKLFKGKIYASVNPVVPKRRTQYEGFPFLKKEAKQQSIYLKKHAKIKLKISNINSSSIEWKLSNAKNLILKAPEIKEIPLHSMEI